MTPTTKPTPFRSARAFRAWLGKHHATATELVIHLFKTHASERGMGYAEALDEALCFGWIDGIRRAHDEDSFTVRFTPRKPNSIWSAVNIRHVARLEAAGRMRPPGLAAFARRTEKRSRVYSFESRNVELAPAYARRFRANRSAWSYFESQAPWYRRTSVFWVMSAKQDETRERRLGVLIDCSARGTPIPQLMRKPSARANKSAGGRKRPTAPGTRRRPS
jgi:uncharacterized protein YdeI (YjbR/CyaY-like superfamily)